jgi:hypothetical protein
MNIFMSDSSILDHPGWLFPGQMWSPGTWGWPRCNQWLEDCISAQLFQIASLVITPCPVFHHISVPFSDDAAPQTLSSANHHPLCFKFRATFHDCPPFPSHSGGKSLVDFKKKNLLISVWHHCIKYPPTYNFNGGHRGFKKTIRYHSESQRQT